MRKFGIILCLGAAALSLASCNREQLTPAPDGLYTIAASREGDAATKTYVDDGLSLVWASGDKLGAFNGENSNVAYALSSGEGTGNAEFSGDTPFDEGKLYAYYPYSESNTDSGAIEVDLSNQAYASAADFGKYFYMVGAGDVAEGETKLNISFKNPLSAFVFTVDNNLDHAITVKGFKLDAPEAIFHRKATLNLTAEDPTVLTATDEAVNEISVDVSDMEVPAGEESSFPLVVLPVDLSGKELTFSFSYVSNGESKSLNKSISGKDIARNTFVSGTFTLAGTTIGGDIEGSWDGTAVSEPETDGSDENVYYIKSAAELAWVAEQVNEQGNTFKGKTLRLMNDINLNGHEWAPIGNVKSYPGTSFHGTFDGQNYTISNLNASDDTPGHASAGLFGSICGTVKNLTLENVDIRSTHYAGAVAGYSSANGAVIENCHVNGGTITTVPEFTGSAYDNGDKAGGIIGYCVVKDVVSGCSVKNVTITGYRDLGGIVGYADATVSDCTVGENVEIFVNMAHNYNNYIDNDEYDAGDVVGEATGFATLTGNSGEADITYGVSVASADELVNAMEILKVASEDAVTISLADDINLNDTQWTPVHTYRPFVFEGNNHTISNLNASTTVDASGFPAVAMFAGNNKSAEFRNLNIDKAIITGDGKSNTTGAVLLAVANTPSTFEKTTVIDNVTISDSKVSNCDRSSVFVTYLYYPSVSLANCTATNCSVESIGTAGALLGINNSNSFTADGCAVNYCTISSTEGSGTTPKAGILIGTWQSTKYHSPSLTNCTYESSKVINGDSESTDRKIGRTV